LHGPVCIATEQVLDVNLLSVKLVDFLKIMVADLEA